MTPPSTTQDPRASRTHSLPHLVHGGFIADGGLETSIIFQQGIDLEDFAAFPLLDSEAGRAALRTYYDPYFELAASLGRGFVVDTPTWRANLDWGARQGYDAARIADVNRRAVRFVAELAGRWQSVPTVVSGTIGPRGDGYVVGQAMSADEATNYHAVQTEAFAAAGADMVTAVTMNHVDEAIGITRAALRSDVAVAVSFTVETDGRLPSGQPLRDAIEQVDAATGQGPAYYLVNCAHPGHFHDVLAEGGAWVGRIRGIRANASALSHAELDEATELDRGDIDDLAARYVALRDVLGPLAVVGGCCGTDHEHIAAIVRSLP